MGAFLLALMPLLGGLTQPLKDYFGYKQKIAVADQEFKLAALKAQSEAIIAQTTADTNQRAAYLGATTQGFRQGTFYFLVCPVILSIVLPSYAQIMWTNFESIPEWFRVLFVSVYSVIWGLPVAKEYIGGMFASLGNAVSNRREYKLEKARINREAVFAGLRKGIFQKGMTQAQVDVISAALDEGEQ